MSKNTRVNRAGERWVKLVEQLEGDVSHLSAWWSDPDRFLELRLKARMDGTVLAIAKGVGADGGPLVCFGSGYGVEGALMAVDSAIQGGNWRFDEPYQAPTSKGAGD